VNKARSRAARVPPALAIAAGGFTVADFTAEVRDVTGQPGYTIRKTAYDLRKVRGKHLADKPGCIRRYLVLTGAARTISACSPSGNTSSRPARPADPPHFPLLDRHRLVQALSLEMMALFAGLGIAAGGFVNLIWTHRSTLIWPHRGQVAAGL
jgi:hypothetical protein